MVIPSFVVPAFIAVAASSSTAVIAASSSVIHATTLTSAFTFTVIRPFF
jgi:hypothetical protein